MRKQQQNGTKPSAVFTRIVKNVKCQFHYLKTVHSLQELDDFRFEHECDFPNKQDFASIRQIPCIKAKPALTGCKFALLAWRPERNQKQIHVYGHGSHNHRIAPIGERAMHQKACWSDEQKAPASFNTPNGCKWTYVETRTMKKSAKKFVNLLLELKRKYHCHTYRKALEVETTRTVVRCLTLYCTNRSAGTSFMCDFKMLIQRTDQDRFHLYTSGQHRCMNKDDNVLSQYVVLPDAHPPASIVTKGGQNWTFMETVEPARKNNNSLVDMTRRIGRKYNCFKPAIGQLIKRSLDCYKRMQLYCTTVLHGECRFRLLAHKTDRGRFHLYKTGKHTCLHGDNGIDRRTSRKYWNRKKRVKQEEEEEKEDDEETDANEEETVEDKDVEEKWIKEEEQDEDEIGNELVVKEKYEIEEEDVDENIEVEEENCVESEEGIVEEEVKEEDNGAPVMADDNDEEEDDGIPFDLRIRSQTLPHEFTEEVQFLDFVDHPKSEGMKMRRLDETKNDPDGVNAVIISMDEEEPARQKMKVPKKEIVKEEALEDQPNTSNRGGQGQQSRTTIENGTTVVPMAVINSRQPALVARVRWWAESVANDGTAARNNEQRLLRERKRRINYRE